MQQAIGGQDGFVRLADGEDLVEALGLLPVKSGVILCGIGMVRDAMLGYWDGNEYVGRALEAPAELLSLQGNIAFHGSERVVHAHVSIADAEGTVWGGHLMAATVHNTAEIALRISSEILLERVEDEEGRLVLRPSMRHVGGDGD